MRILRTAMTCLALLLAANVAGAQMMGGAGQGMGGSMLRVAPNGTTLVLRPTFAAQGTTPTRMELVAFTPAGSVAWRQAVGFGMQDIALAGGLVVLSDVQGMGPGGSMGNPGAAKSNVHALDLGSGVAAWNTQIDGVVLTLAIDTGRIYAEVVTPGPGSHGMHGGGNGGGAGNWMNGTFRLVAIGLDGRVLWSQRLN